MARYLILCVLIILFGCEMNGKQIIKPEKFNYDEIKFNSVSKKLIYNNDLVENPEIKKIIKYWFDNKIKTDGFDGSLNVVIKDIKTERITKKEYFKFSINMTIEFEEKSNDLNRTKIFTINALEYGDIIGNFSINDQENLRINIIHKSLQSVSKKIKEIN